MIRTIFVGVIIAAIAAGAGSCTRIEDSMQAVKPELVASKFFEAWKNRDWGAVYELSHPSFMQKVRMQKLSPELRAMTDRELFIYEFERFQKSRPDMVLRTYEIRSVTPYKTGDTTLWVDALINGKKRMVPIALDGIALKVDMTRIR
ncbi:MAG: hypothetical protein JW807_15865 [Spirochaetes bacterium]|nr:hypothetical protein [Spirochaetota bacterium]